MGQLGTEIRDWVISIAVAVALAMFIRTFVVELYHDANPGASAAPCSK